MSDSASIFFKTAKYAPTFLAARSISKNMTARVNPAISSPKHTPFTDEKEKREILDRVNWLCSEVITEPSKLIDKMPAAIGRFYQGQWAIYACVMTAVALSNIAYLYPETRSKCLARLPKLIDMILSPEIKEYDACKWNEDPIASLEGDKSHMTYLSLLALVLGHYKLTGGDIRYDTLHHKICASLARRMNKAKHFNLPSFPNGIVFLPDMMVAPLSLKIYDSIYGDHYSDLIDNWKKNIQRYMF